MNHLRRCATVVALLAIALLPIAATPPANAAYSDCPSGKFCVWSGPSGTGVIGIFSSGDSNLAIAPGPSGLNNTIESVRNRTGSRWCLWDGAGYTGEVFDITSGFIWDLPAGYDNMVSSLRPC